MNIYDLHYSFYTIFFIVLIGLLLGGLDTLF